MPMPRIFLPPFKNRANKFAGCKSMERLRFNLEGKIRVRNVALDGQGDVLFGVPVHQPGRLDGAEPGLELLQADAPNPVRVKVREPLHLLHQVVLLGDEADQDGHLHGVQGAQRGAAVEVHKTRLEHLVGDHHPLHCVAHVLRHFHAVDFHRFSGGGGGGSSRCRRSCLLRACWHLRWGRGARSSSARGSFRSRSRSVCGGRRSSFAALILFIVFILRVPQVVENDGRPAAPARRARRRGGTTSLGSGSSSGGSSLSLGLGGSQARLFGLCRGSVSFGLFFESSVARLFLQLPVLRGFCLLFLQQLLGLAARFLLSRHLGRRHRCLLRRFGLLKLEPRALRHGRLLRCFQRGRLLRSFLLFLLARGSRSGFRGSHGGFLLFLGFLLRLRGR
mmetsp:Transcript_33717/g.61640  ORF Transcript_33717/g.61640 Transcript_33717/m.61640 type:complete len:391 (-) Transcript_33717:1831-3003(-)